MRQLIGILKIKKLKSKVLIIGSNSQIGKTLKNQNNNSFIFCYRNSKQLNYYDKKLEYKILKINPKIIVNLAAFTNVEKAEINKKRAKYINASIVKKICTICKKRKIKLIHISTDYVFNTFRKKFIPEDFRKKPQNYYGYTKLLGEQHIINSNVSYIIIRTSWVFSEFKENFVKKIIKLYKKNKILKVVKDEIGRPTSSDLLSAVILRFIKILDNKELFKEIIHITNNGYVSRYNYAKKILELYFKEKKPNLIPVLSKDFKTLAYRSKFSILNINKAQKKYKFKINNWEKDLKMVIKNIKI